jgi:hypothetical protein
VHQYGNEDRRGREWRYLKAVNTRDFLLEGLVNKAMLFHHWDPFKCFACNGDGIERPTATYAQNKYVNILGSRGRVAGWRTRNVLYEQLGGLKTL